MASELDANKNNEGKWFRKTCYPRGFEKPFGSHMCLNHLFLQEEEGMRSASVMPTSATKKSCSEELVTQRPLENPW